MKQNNKKKSLRVTPDYLKNRSKKKVVSADKILWNYIGNRRLSFTFRKNHPLLRYIIDFYSVTLRLAIEIVDASYSTTDKERKRDENLSNIGVTILRFTENEVRNDIDKVIEAIQNNINELRENKVEDEQDYDEYDND